MTLKHSPGPFTFHRPGWYIEDSDGNAIAEVNSAYPGDGQIFAAAPDMLRLLLAILRNHRAADYGGMIKSLGSAAQFVERLDGDTCHGK